MKTLLIPFFFLAAVITANAHCGSCGTGEAHHEVKSEAKECSAENKAACAKDKECSAEKKAACAEDKECSAENKADKKADAAKAAIPMPKMACCPKES